MCALQWKCYDPDKKILYIHRGVFEGQFHSPKGQKQRVVPLPPLAFQLLSQLRPPNAQPDGLIFHTRTGRPYRQTQIGYRYIAPAAQRAGLGRVTAHQLRHIHSSVLHDQGTPIGIIQKQLGHSRIETTMNTYTHVIPESQRQAVERLEKALSQILLKWSAGERLRGS